MQTWTELNWIYRYFCYYKLDLKLSKRYIKDDINGKVVEFGDQDI